MTVKSKSMVALLKKVAKAADKSEFGNGATMLDAAAHIEDLENRLRQIKGMASTA